MIDIKELNIKNIDFLNYDTNYIDGYSQYENLDIFTLSYQFGDELDLQVVNLKEYLMNINFFMILILEKVLLVLLLFCLQKELLVFIVVIKMKRN